MRSECQHVHFVNSLAPACFQVAKFLEAVFRVTSVAWERRIGKLAPWCFARDVLGVLTMRPLIQRELSCRRRRLRVSLTTMLAKKRVVGRRAGSAYG